MMAKKKSRFSGINNYVRMPTTIHATVPGYIFCLSRGTVLVCNGAGTLFLACTGRAMAAGLKNCETLILGE
jgi:hypothetical protein